MDVHEDPVVEALARGATEVLFPWEQMPFEGRVLAWQDAERYLKALRADPALWLACGPEDVQKLYAVTAESYTRFKATQKPVEAEEHAAHLLALGSVVFDTVSG